MVDARCLGKSEAAFHREDLSCASQRSSPLNVPMGEKPDYKYLSPSFNSIFLCKIYFFADQIYIDQCFSRTVSHILRAILPVVMI